MGLVMVISMVAAYFGAQFLAPQLIAALPTAAANFIASSPLATMAVQGAMGVIASKFATTLAVTGDLGKTLQAVFSMDTVIAAAFNILTQYLTLQLADFLKI